jgi:hypothetical protein
MKALIWKECHENLKWAMLPVLLLGGLMALQGPPALMRYNTSLFLSLIAAVSAGALGFLQVVFESRGDQRAMLLHRPISRFRIFLSKAVAGVGLYLLALGIPLTGAVLWSAAPGHMDKPFHPAMALPWVADVLAGVVYYFAGMLTAQREARWYGSRGLPFAAALLCSFLVWALPEFWQALLAIGLSAALVATAAWGSFRTGGAYAPQPRLARVCLVVTLLAGLLVAGIVGKLAVGAWFDTNERSYYTLDRQGRLLIVHQQPGQDTRVSDLEGRTPRQLAGKQIDPNVLREIEAPLSPVAFPKFDSYRHPARFMIRYQHESIPPGERWYYVPPEGILVGYDLQTKRLIGRVGPDGFVGPGERPRERFQGRPFYPDDVFDAGSCFFLDGPDAVYTVDLGRRRIWKVFTPTEGQTVQWVLPWRDVSGKRTLAFICTDRSVQVVDEAGRTVFAAPLLDDVHQPGPLRIARLENPRRFAIWYEPVLDQGVEAGKTLPGELVEYDPAGREVARRPVPPRPLARPADAQALFGLAMSPAEAAALSAGTRDIISLGGSYREQKVRPLVVMLVMVSNYFIPGAGWHSGADRGQVLAFEGLILVSALLCALLCFLLARSHAFSWARCVGWTLGGLLFGPAGLLLLLAVEEWPARIACPGCGKRRVVSRDTCEHCGARHAVPAADGTEVFEQSAAPQAALAGR